MTKILFTNLVYFFFLIKSFKIKQKDFYCMERKIILSEISSPFIFIVKKKGKIKYTKSRKIIL